MHFETDMNLEQYQFFQTLKKFSFIEEIWIYGSRARKDYQSRSDLDKELQKKFYEN